MNYKLATFLHNTFPKMFNGYWGYHGVFDVSGCSNDMISDGDHIVRFIKDLVIAIDMKAYGEPMIERFATHDPTKGGYSFCQMIETSNICAHFVEADDTMYLDVFSCKWFDAEIVKEKIEEYFGADKIKIKFMLRKA